MNNRLLLTLGCMSALAFQPAVAGPYERQDFAKVVSATPIYEQVAYTRPSRECWVETVAYEREHGGKSKSATPMLLGAVIGGAIGHAVGKNDRRSGTAIGAVLGGSIGNDMGKSRRHSSVEYRDEERCETRQVREYEERLMGYDVTYRYHGETYTTRMDHKPGKRLPVAVSVTPIY
ncbi:glycine zipper 2TM domain-containing protein [Simiduia sp. 21SJ11W-1]|uniref:glycine zipper 2TM domain-containing protein n=1 Tax=Simiduia sp. 21SJ11W-1 TaxID=2909669 RepID=UPI0020A0B410|nr:glycine zipper 2TM domain-containing protein [Simiduia sp. 21SJ11W-1]UTA46492.1 glycine zipper 2TM domain-containing protein [Simiduia sp. 21SJ11W-1]